MPSHKHEALIALFRDHPELAVNLLDGIPDVEIPAYTAARVTSGDLTDIAPTEYRADLVISLTDSDEKSSALAVIVEVQLRRDVRKRRTWPAYVSTLHARHGCPVYLLVVCPDPAVATWCAETIVIGRLTLAPVVLGPENTPIVTEPEQARADPELAVLSAMAHGPSQGQTVFHALLAALEVVEPDLASRYADLVFAVLPRASRQLLETYMATATDHRYYSEFARRYYSQGEAKGEIKAKIKDLLTVLDVRGLTVTDDDRRRITTCTDINQLDTWFERAITAHTTQEIFAD